MTPGPRFRHRRYEHTLESQRARAANAKRSDDLPRAIEAEGPCSDRARHIDLGEAPADVEKAVLDPMVSLKEPMICPAPLMREATVPIAPGTSIWVKLPPILRKPC